MSEIITVGFNLTMNVFVASGASSIQIHGADTSVRAVLRKKLRRDQVLAFSGQLLPYVVAMVACGGAHFWGREIGKLGHEVRLIPLPTSSYSLSDRSTMQRMRRRSAKRQRVRRCALCL
jgi:transposase